MRQRTHEIIEGAAPMVSTTLLDRADDVAKVPLVMLPVGRTAVRAEADAEGRHVVAAQRVHACESVMHVSPAAAQAPQTGST